MATDLRNAGFAVEMGESWRASYMDRRRRRRVSANAAHIVFGGWPVWRFSVAVLLLLLRCRTFDQMTIKTIYSMVAGYGWLRRRLRHPGDFILLEEFIEGRLLFMHYHNNHVTRERMADITTLWYRGFDGLVFFSEICPEVALERIIHRGDKAYLPPDVMRRANEAVLTANTAFYSYLRPLLCFALGGRFFSLDGKLPAMQKANYVIEVVLAERSARYGN